MADRDTTGTPYKWSFDGKCYFRYPDGDAPLPPPEYYRYATQSGAGLRNGTSPENAWAASDLTRTVWEAFASDIVLNLSGEFTSGMAVWGGGVEGQQVTVRGPATLNGNLTIAGEKAKYLRFEDLTINGGVVSYITHYGTTVEMNYTDSTTVVTPAGYLTSTEFVAGGIIMINEGFNGTSKHYEIASIDRGTNTLTIIPDGTWLFDPTVEDGRFSTKHYHHGLSFIRCDFHPTVSTWEIFPDNMGNDMLCVDCEFDGGDLPFAAASYSTGRDAPKMTYNHRWEGCHIHNIGELDSAQKQFDCHGMGAQVIDGLVFTRCRVEEVACGYVLFPGGDDTGEIPNTGIHNVEISYCLFKNMNARRHINQYLGGGIYGTGNGPTQAVGTWKIFHNVFVDCVEPEMAMTAYGGDGITCKGNGVTNGKTYAAYNNTIIEMAKSFYFNNLLLGGNIVNNISINNIVDARARHGQFNAASGVLNVNHNIYWPDRGNNSFGGASGWGWATHQGQGLDPDSAMADPLLDANYRPQPGSPAIGNGVLMDANQRWLGNVTWPIGTDGGSFEFIDLTSAPTIGAFAETT